jgi:uncharacterized protein YidB (DUF937 family)
MSGLDDLLGGVLGGKGAGLGGILGGLAGGGGSGLGGAGAGGAVLSALVPLVGGLLAGGGLGKLVSGLQAQGLGSKADSWVGKGENEPVSGDDLRTVLSDEQIGEIADKLGVSHEQAAAAVAQVLPHVVDHVTPDGTVPADEHVDDSLRKLAQSAAGAS